MLEEGRYYRLLKKGGSGHTRQFHTDEDCYCLKDVDDDRIKSWTLDELLKRFSEEFIKEHLCRSCSGDYERPKKHDPLKFKRKLENMDKDEI